MPQNMENVNRTLEELGENSGGANYFKFKEGPQVLRIIPPFGDRQNFWKEFQVCFNVGPNKKRIVPSDSDDCPMRKKLKELKDATDPVSKKEYEQVRAKDRIVFFVIDRNEPEKGAQCVDTNKNVLRDILAIMADKEYGDITDPVTGTDITITFTPKERTKDHFPAWDVLARRQSTPLGNDELLKEDLFEKFRIGKASETEYILAVFAGRDQEYIDAKNAAAGVGTAGVPATDSHPSGRSLTLPCLPTQEFFAFVNGAVVTWSAAQIREHLLAGNAIEHIQTLDQKSGWVAPAALGFVVQEPKPIEAPAVSAPPATPPASPAASPMPPAGASEVAAPSRELTEVEKLEAQLKALKGNGVSPQSDVAKELQGSLAK